MPVYTLQGPDGKTYKIEGPAGATAEQLSAFITGKPAGPSMDEKVAATRAQMEQEYAPTVGMSGLEKFVSGYGKAGSDLVQGVKQLGAGVADFVNPREQGISSLVTGKKTPSRVEELRQEVGETRKLDKSLMDSGAGMAGNLTGNLAAFAPTAFIPGANTATGGALIGAASGLVAPSTSTGETLKNVGVGGATGAAIPTLITALKTGKSLIEPLYQGGRDKIVGRALTDAAATDPQALAQALRTNQSPIPGVQRTVAEVADNPSLAALQRTASQTSPAVVNEAAARAAANNDARVAALQGLSPDKQAALKAREAATSALYGQADAMPVDTSKLTDLLQRPSIQSAVKRAGQLAAEAGETFDVGNLTGRGAHYIKKAMDDIANGNPAMGTIGGNEQRAVRDTLTEYLSRLETQLAPYGQARTTYAAMSRPVNQADVIDEVASKAINRNGNLTPAAYANALSDKTAQRVTGQSGATMGKVLEPGQMQTLNAIRDDLARAEFAQTAGKGVGSDTVQKLAYSNLMNQAGVPSLVRNLGPAGVVGNLAQRAGQVVYKDANEKLAEQLARALLNPEEAANLVTGAMVNPQLAALANGLRRSGTVAGASAPALVQANQQ